MKYIKYIALAGLVGLTSSCIDDLLNRPATTEGASVQRPTAIIFALAN